MWERFKSLQGGVLVVGHGTRLASGVAQLLDLSRQIQRRLPTLSVEAAFLELAKPTIFDAMLSLHANGVRRVFVVPILLFEAAHAQTDIPDAVKDAARTLEILVFGQSTPLGTHPAALEISEFRFKQALRCQSSAGCLMAGACSRADECLAVVELNPQALSPDSFPSKVGLAMVGRGSSDLAALDHMRCFTKQHVAHSKTKLDWSQTGFFAGGKPTIDDLLLEAKDSECDIVVVQPHLLFEGELIQQLRSKVAHWQQVSPLKRWLVPPTLGADPKLANAFLSLAGESLRESLSKGDIVDGEA